MSKHVQFTGHVDEAVISIESALAAAEIVAQCDIVESQAFNQMVLFMLQTAEALANIQSTRIIARSLSSVRRSR